MIINDAHCHFFSRNFFDVLARQSQFAGQERTVEQVIESLGWDDPGSPPDLADRWVRELDRNGVDRACLIASVPGDEDSVAAAVQRHPARFVGFFMVDATRDDAASRVAKALSEKALHAVCLFPAMHGFSLQDEKTLELFQAVAAHQGCVFVHCGVLTVGVRKKLGLPGRFDLRLGNPLDLHQAACSFPELPILIPHFGAGFFREALMMADLHPNIHLDTSSSNQWMKYHPGLGLEEVFERALDVVGPTRLLFGSDSSFFPRGWNRIIWESQQHALVNLGIDGASQRQIFRENLDRLFPKG